MQTAKHSEPLIRVVKRGEISTGKKIAIRLIAVVLALIVDALFIYFVTGLNPLDVYKAMIQGTFSTTMRFSWAMRDLASLLLIGIALAPAFRMRFWNIGAEGQVLMGALATAAVMVYYGGKLPNWLLYTVMLVVGVLAGAVWGFIPAWFNPDDELRCHSARRLLCQYLARSGFQLGQAEHEEQGRLVPADHGSALYH